MEDFQWLFAAYKMGKFEEFPQDLGRYEFQDAFMEVLTRDWHEAYLLSAMHPRGPNTPVGLVAMRVRDNRGDRLTVEPHVTWFPWASLRNKIETTVKFINHQRVDRFVLIFADKEAQPFFEKSIKRYGILRTSGGYISKYPPHNNGPAYIFESKEIDE